MVISKFNSKALRGLCKGDTAIFLNEKPTTYDSINRAFKRNEGACSTKQGLLVLDVNSPISVVYVECVEPMKAKSKG